MAEERSLAESKRRIRESGKRDSAKRLFYETYDALLNTLRETYTACSKLPDRDPTANLVATWYEEMRTLVPRVKSCDKTLMLGNIRVLMALHIPQLWIEGKFTANSQKYMWIYIENLCNFSTTASESASDITPAVSGDIRAPEHMPPATMPGIKQIYDELPKNMLNKVKDIAEKYSADIESGKTKLEELKFDVISKELFSQIDPNEMHKMVTSIGSMLQGAMQDGGGAGDMGDLFRMFAQEQPSVQP